LCDFSQGACILLHLSISVISVTYVIVVRGPVSFLYVYISESIVIVVRRHVSLLYVSISVIPPLLCDCWKGACIITLRINLCDPTSLMLLW
jgi:hypothetical protein